MIEDDPEFLAECRLLGIDPTKLGGRRQARGLAVDPIPIWPDMVDAWALFLAMGTQWDWVGAGFGAFQVGLKYGSLETVARSIDIPLTPDGRIPGPVFADVRTLEGEALRYWSAKRR